MRNPSINRLKELYLCEHYKDSNFPKQCRCTPPYTEKTANGLTKCVVSWLRLSGWQAERISNTGRLIDRRKIVVDCIGRQKQIGSTQWIKGSGTKGTADISATIAGKSVKIEIKVGKDRISDHQRQYQNDVERSGGVYLIVKDFCSFLQWYDSFIEKEVNHGS